MNCLNCGAPLELGESRTVLSCGYCSSSRYLEPNTESGDRVVSLDHPTGINCPRCETELVQAAIDGRRASFCTGCRGILMEAPIFAEVAWKRRTKYRGPEMVPLIFDPQSLQEVIDCPNCHERMDVHPHYGPGRAVIDSCHHCHLVWLDDSELTSIEQTPGRR